MGDKNISMIDKAMEVLELLSEQSKGLTSQELTDILRYPKSSVYKIVTILFDSGYLGREPKNLKYFLSRKMLSIGLKAISSYDIIEKSEDYMIRLRDDVGESVMIGALIDKEVILIKQIQGSLDFVFTLKDGMRFNLYSTAPGKTLLAFMPESQRQEKLENIELDAINEYTITEKERLVTELNKIQIEGYSIDLNETVIGVHCIAAPIFDEMGKAIACVWISGPSGRLHSEKIKEVGEKVKNLGLDISRNIGCKH